VLRTAVLEKYPFGSQPLKQKALTMTLISTAQKSRTDQFWQEVDSYIQQYTVISAVKGVDVNGYRYKAFLKAKGQADALEEKSKLAGAVLKKFPSGPMGLTPDSVRTSPEFRKAKADFDSAFSALRKFNQYFVKEFSKEYRKYRELHPYGSKPSQ